MSDAAARALLAARQAAVVALLLDEHAGDAAAAPAIDPRWLAVARDVLRHKRAHLAALRAHRRRR